MLRGALTLPQVTHPPVAPTTCGRCPETYLHTGPPSTGAPFLFSPGVATYTDKLFKFRNNRWEDILSDEVNVARGVASLFAGRSVACVDRTVSSGVRGGPGEKRGARSDGRAWRGANRQTSPDRVRLSGAEPKASPAAPTVPCT